MPEQGCAMAAFARVTLWFKASLLDDSVCRVMALQYLNKLRFLGSRPLEERTPPGPRTEAGTHMAPVASKCVDCTWQSFTDSIWHLFFELGV